MPAGKTKVRKAGSARTETLGQSALSTVGQDSQRNPIKAKTEQVDEASKLLFGARGVWQEANARLQQTSPMDEDYVEAVQQVERATTAYLAASRIFQNACKRV